MELSEHNRDNKSSLIGGNMLNLGMEAFFILFFLDITTKLVTSQINFECRHFGTLLQAKENLSFLNIQIKCLVFQHYMLLENMLTNQTETVFLDKTVAHFLRNNKKYLNRLSVV